MSSFYAYDVDEFGLARALVLGDGKNNTFNSGVFVCEQYFKRC